MMKPATIDYVFWPASVRRYSFREHLEAAQAGRFTSLAVAPETYRQAASFGLSPSEMVAMASDKGIALRHLDTLTDWAPIRVPSEINPELRARFDIRADECFAICEALGLETILAVAGYDKGDFPLEVLVEGFGRLCDRAAQNGLWVDLEFMPFWGHLRRIGPEVFSEEADGLSPVLAGQRSAESLWRVLKAAGIPSPDDYQSKDC